MRLATDVLFGVSVVGMLIALCTIATGRLVAQRTPSMRQLVRITDTLAAVFAALSAFFGAVYLWRVLG